MDVTLCIILSKGSGKDALEVLRMLEAFFAKGPRGDGTTGSDAY